MNNKANKQNLHKIDILAIGPHPDDIEFGCGGYLSKAAKAGYITAIVDMSLAELSTNGDTKTRLKEADEARKILGAKYRENLKIANNFFYNNKKNLDKVINVIRKYKPEMLLLPYYFDRHPDHENASKIIREAIFTSGLSKYKTGQPNHRPKYVYLYMMWYEFKPSVVVNIDETFETKMKAVLAYKSQFQKSDGKKVKKTIDNDDRTLKYVEARARTYGFYIGKTFGEPFLSLNPVGLDNPFDSLPNMY